MSKKITPINREETGKSGLNLNVDFSQLVDAVEKAQQLNDLLDEIEIKINRIGNKIVVSEDGKIIRIKKN